MIDYDNIIKEQIIKSDNKLIEQKKIQPKYLCEFCHSNDYLYDEKKLQISCSNCGSLLETTNLIDEELYFLTSCQYNNTNTSIKNYLVPEHKYKTILRNLKNSIIRNKNNWSDSSYQNRSKIYIFSLIKKKGYELKLNKNITDDIMILYYNIFMLNDPIKNYVKIKSKKLKTNIFRGKHKLGIIAACFYYSCKRLGYILTIKNIAKTFNITSACANNGCKIFMKYLLKSKLNFNILISKPSDFIENICDNLNNDILKINLNIKDKRTIKLILNLFEQNYLLSDHNPYSIAVVTILLYLEIKNIPSNINLIIKTLNISKTVIIKIFKLFNKFNDSFIKLIIKIENHQKIDFDDIKKYIINDNNIISDEKINKKIDKLNKINIDVYKKFDNINYRDIVLKKDENIFNNDFIESLKYF